MRVWTNTKFDGLWPVGTAAVVVSPTQEEAAVFLNEELKRLGLGCVIEEDMEEVSLNNGNVRILCDGNY